MVVQPIGINDIPNEIVLQILSPLSTSKLLSIAPISTRFRSLVYEVLSHRLHDAASLPAHNLILEAFHPSEKLSAPSMTCVYLFTDPFIPSSETSPTIPAVSPAAQRDLPNLSALYSHFKPLLSANASPRRIRRFRPPPSVGASSSPTEPPEGNAVPERPSQLITLEAHELFSQLCTIVNLVRLSPRPGLFLSCVTVNEGVLRVFRDWLARRALADAETGDSSATKYGVDVDKGKSQADEINQDNAILWLGNDKHVGLKLRVTERPDLSPPKPILQREGEDEEIVYSVEYVEVLIKTTRLLLKLEQSAAQQAQQSSTSTGLMIGSGVVVGPNLSMG